MTQPNGFFVDAYGNTLKSGIVIAADGSVQIVAPNANGQQVITPIGNLPTGIALLNTLQQLQQLAGATTSLLSSDETHLKDPLGVADIPLGVSNVYQDSSAGPRTLTVDDMKGGASSFATAAIAITVPKDLGVAGGIKGGSFYISGTVAPTFAAVSGVTINDQRLTGTGRTYFNCVVNWVNSNTYEVIGVQS